MRRFLPKRRRRVSVNAQLWNLLAYGNSGLLKHAEKGVITINELHLTEDSPTRFAKPSFSLKNISFQILISRFYDFRFERKNICNNATF